MKPVRLLLATLLVTGAAVVPVDAPAAVANTVTAGSSTRSPVTLSTSASPSTSKSGGTAAASATPTVSILGFSPRLPDVADTTQVITIEVEITNPTDKTLHDLELGIDRGAPIVSERELELSIPSPPPAIDRELAPTKVAGTLAPHTSRRIGLPVISGQGGLCLGCGTEKNIQRGTVYPIDVSLGNSSTGSELARTHTLLPAFNEAPEPVQVSWIWPLIDGPHREVSGTVFDDDHLAAAVSAGGRLDRALRVAELVRGTVALNLVVDPDLIDSLTVMSTGYSVRTGGTTTPGTGGPAAAAWLHRLKVVAAGDSVTLTPYADADVDALAAAGMPVPTTLDSSVAADVRAVLPRTSTSLVWPAGEHLSTQGLDAVLAAGAHSVLLDDDALAGVSGKTSDRTSTPADLAPLPGATGAATAVVLESSLQDQYLQVTARHPSAAAQQRLFALLAVRAAQQPSHAHFVALAPGRYVDPNPGTVASTMQALAGSTWSTSLTVAAALTSVTPVDHGALKPAGLDATIGLGQLSALADVVRRVATLRSCVDNADAETLLGGYATAVARGTSSWWRSHPGAGRHFVGDLHAAIANLEGGIRIASSDTQSLTMLSSAAPIRLVVQNTLSVPVSFKLDIEPRNGDVGFSTDPMQPETLQKYQRATITIKAHVQRSGRFEIAVQVVNPDGDALGPGLPFRVTSKAYGRAALWITFGAFGVLVLALVVRAGRRLVRYLRRDRATSSPPRPTTLPAPQ